SRARVSSVPVWSAAPGAPRAARGCCVLARFSSGSGARSLWPLRPSRRGFPPAPARAARAPPRGGPPLSPPSPAARCSARPLGLDSPRVGLLSVGEEEGKGNELTKETYEQLRESSLNFVGNVEGRDIYNGRCDVVVTDGFTGNVALKISESLAEMIGAMIKEELTRDFRSKIGAALSTPAFTRFRKRVDYTEFGGAPLLGIDGEAIICHGRSPAKAIKNAVRVAAEWAKKGLNEHIRAALEAEVARGGRE